MAMMRTKAHVSLGTVELLPGFKLWREVTVYAEDHKGYDVEARVVFEDGRLTARSVKVAQRPDGPPVTGEALRQVPVAWLVRHSLETTPQSPFGPGFGQEPGKRFEMVLFGMLEPEDVQRMRAAGPTDETLEWVARTYTLALAVGDRPTKAVKEVFEIAQSTAGQWVARARDRGFLGTAEPGKAG
jgi:hypothetical protein